MPDVDLDQIRALPKVSLHDHLDGGLRPATVLELATEIGRAATASLETDRPQVLIVRDTRESGPMLEAALAAQRAGVAER